MVEFTDKKINDEYFELDAEASEIEDRLSEINERQKFIRDNYEQA